MATHDYVLANQSGSSFRTDLNNALAAVVSNNSNSSEPSTTYAYMFWADTTNGVLKIRNSANNAWIELLQLDGTLTMEDGAEATPGLAFRDDLNTGIWSSAADTFNISTGGTERLELGAATVFNESGADVDFRIEGDTEANLFYLNAGNDAIGVGTNAADTPLHVYKQLSDRTARFQRISSQTLDINQTGGANSIISAGKNFEVGTSDSQSLVLKTDGGTRLTLDTSGNATLADGNLVVANTHGIDFSATADGTGSNQDEVFDDYEHGYFSPNIQPNSGSISWNSAQDLCSYTKIGRKVFIQGSIMVDSVSSPTGITRGTLPFAQASLTDESERTSGVCLVTGTSLNCNEFAIYPNGGTDSYLEIIRCNAATFNRDACEYFGTGDKVYFSYSYQTT